MNLPIIKLFNITKRTPLEMYSYHLERLIDVAFHLTAFSKKAFSFAKDFQNSYANVREQTEKNNDKYDDIINHNCSIKEYKEGRLHVG